MAVYEKYIWKQYVNEEYIFLKSNTVNYVCIRESRPVLEYF